MTRSDDHRRAGKGQRRSADVIKKVRSRGASAKAEDAWRIAAYFGKELPQFIKCEAVPDDQEFRSLLRASEPAGKKLLVPRCGQCSRFAKANNPQAVAAVFRRGEPPVKVGQIFVTYSQSPISPRSGILPQNSADE